MGIFFIKVIDIYKKVISPYIISQCRFYPTCSFYARDAFITHNSLKAVLLVIVRLSKCNPFFSGGYDPINQKRGFQQKDINNE